MRRRASALIIRDKKILLVSDKNVNFYWTPGGKLEGGETFEEALFREVKEEIGAEIVTLEPYLRYTAQNIRAQDIIFPPCEIQNYLVSIEGDITPKAEIKTVIWASKNDLENIVVTNVFKEKTITKLITDGLL